MTCDMSGETQEAATYRYHGAGGHTETSTPASTPVASVPPCEMTNAKRRSREVHQAYQASFSLRSPQVDGDDESAMTSRTPRVHLDVVVVG